MGLAWLGRMVLAPACANQRLLGLGVTPRVPVMVCAVFRAGATLLTDHAPAIRASRVQDVKLLVQAFTAATSAVETATAQMVQQAVACVIAKVATLATTAQRNVGVCRQHTANVTALACAAACRIRSALA